MNIIKGATSLAIIVLLVVGVLFVDFAYKTFSYRKQPVHSDAIIVLTGGKGRVSEGVKLYREGNAKYLMIIGADPSVRKSDIYRAAKGDPPSENLILEKNSRNTIENAIYGSSVIKNYNVKSILLITSRYHMKRATILLRNALPPECRIHPHPIDSKNLKERWWDDSGSINLLFSEFYKYCLLKIFFIFAPGELRGDHSNPSVSSMTVSALFSV